jgi:hypothetical protein
VKLLWDQKCKGQDKKKRALWEKLNANMQSGISRVVRKLREHFYTSVGLDVLIAVAMQRPTFEHIIMRSLEELFGEIQRKLGKELLLP